MHKDPVFVSDIMSKPVVAVTLRHIVRDILTTFSKKGISGVPVVDNDGKLIGIVSSLDLILAATVGKISLRLGELPLVMTAEKEVVKLKADAPIKEAILAVLNKRLGRVVVIDDDNRPIGIVSRNDLLHYLLKRIS